MNELEARSRGAGSRLLDEAARADLNGLADANHLSRLSSFGGNRQTGLRSATSMLAMTGLAGAMALAGCGGGGGSAPKDAPDATLFALSFSVPNYSGIFLDEDVIYRFSAPVKEGTINPDSIRMRTGAVGGIAPFGTFVRGIFMVDPSTGNRVVIDKDQILATTLDRFERRGNISNLSQSIRFDLGFDAVPTSNGVRRPLFDRSRKAEITFVPEIPTRAALDDTGYQAGSTYNCAVPGFPSTNTLENLAGSPLLSPNGRVFTSSFTTVPVTAGQLFIGAESAGIPRVIHSDPYNGTDNVPLDKRIDIRFSQPLDPRNVATEQFRVEVVSVAAPFPVIPVSVFLAQERLGRCQVSLTPINPFPANATIRVTIDPSLEDLLGQPINPTVISFFTGASGVPFVPDFLEEFDTNTQEDVALSNAIWNGNRPYVDSTPGELKAAFAPYAGDGSDGAFLGVPGQTVTLSTGNLTQRIYNYTTFTLPIGATLTATGNFPLVIHCQGNVDVSGTIRLDGQKGVFGSSSSDNSSTVPRGGMGGNGGVGGGDGGAGAFFVIGSGGNFDGIAGEGLGAGNPGFTGNQEAPVFTRARPNGTQQSCTLNVGGNPNSFEECRQREGGGGGGYAAAGGDADNNGATGLGFNGSLVANGGNGGAAWGNSSLTFASTSAVVSVFDVGTGGTKIITLNGIPTLVSLHGGSGGGGGGGEDDRDGSNVNGTADGGDEGGGGGGGGGGAIQIVSYTNITVSGRILCNGGAGGNSSIDDVETDFGEGAGGGGGSGGTIWLQCRGSATVNGGAIIEALPGIGGSGYADGTAQVYKAGDGAEGRIRIEDGDGLSLLPGTVQPVASVGVFTPALDLASSSTSIWTNTGIFTPDYSEPEIDAEVLPLPGSGKIRIYMEGTQEDVSTGVDDPDLTKATGFIKVYDTDLGGILSGAPWDLLDNNKWWRFKVEFDVDAFHSFTDPLPTVRSILFKISQ